MAFSDYKHIAQVQQEYQITYREQHFLVAQPQEPSPQFLDEFAFVHGTMAADGVSVSMTKAAVAGSRCGKG